MRVGIALLIGLGIAGCEADPQSLRWSFRFADETVEARARLIEARIHEGSCFAPGATDLYAAELDVGAGGPLASSPPLLGPGRYALEGVARGDDCAQVASGCTEVTLPRAGSDPLTVLLIGSDAPAECPTDRCLGGRCVVPDLDAGLDAGDLDAAGLDARPPVPDAGPDGGSGCGACPLGCSVADPTRCAAIVPSNVGSAAFDESAIDVAPTMDVAFDTDICSPMMATGIVLPQPAGPEICVLRYHDLWIRPGMTVRFFGRRAVAIVATGDVLVEGIVDVSAVGAEPGAGGFEPGMGRSPGMRGGASAGFDDGGAGGGGLCGRGGAGGGTDRATGGPGGAVFGGWDLVPLLGGSGGGSGASDTKGGAGGGALQITARGSISIAGTILAGGGGGQGGQTTMSDNSPGGGGGSGGAILLEATTVTITGSVRGVGGGGGGGAVYNAGVRDPGDDGTDGRTADPSAPGGSGGSIGALSGGEGGSSGGSPLDGNPGTRGNEDGGGGGGGAGCILIRDATGALPPDVSAMTPRDAPGLRALPVMVD